MNPAIRAVLAALLITMLAVAASAAVETTGANVATGPIDDTFYASPTGNAGATGTDRDHPTTLTHALALAKANKQAATPRGTRVVLLNGLYREPLILELNDPDNWKSSPLNAGTPLIIEAEDIQKAIVTGADRYEGWTKVEEGLYSHPWMVNFTAGDKDAKKPMTSGYFWRSTYPTSRNNAILARREMVFVDGMLMRQVVADQDRDDANDTWTNIKAALLQYNGSFYANQTEGKDIIYLHPPAHVDPNAVDVEVAVRNVFRLAHCNNVTVRGITFQYDPSFIEHSGVRVDYCNNVLMEDCQVLWTSWGGLQTQYCKNMTYRRLRCNNNGCTGLTTYRSYDILNEDSETCGNNWRGDWGEYWGWSASGVKDFLSHRLTYRGLKSCYNKTGGYWMDIDGEDIVLDRCLFEGNKTQGLFFEASDGPYLLKNSIICRNGDGGVRGGHSERVTIDHCVFFGNGTAHVKIVEQNADRKQNHLDETTFKNSAEEYAAHTRKWTLTNNVFVCESPKQRMVTTTLNPTYYGYWADTLAADHNMWWGGDAATLFPVIDGKSIKMTNFVGWKASINGGTQEQHSR